MSHYRLADAGRLRVVELSGLYREMSLKNTELEIFLPEMDFCTELELHSSPWVQKGEDSEAT